MTPASRRQRTSSRLPFCILRSRRSSLEASIQPGQTIVYSPSAFRVLSQKFAPSSLKCSRHSPLHASSSCASHPPTILPNSIPPRLRPPRKDTHQAHSTTPAPPYSTESAPQKYKFKHSFVTSSPTESNPNSDRHGRKTTTYRSAQSPASHLTCPTGHARHQIHKSQRLRPYSPSGASPSSNKLSYASLSDTVLLTQSVAQLRPSHSSCLPQTGQSSPNSVARLTVMVTIISHLNPHPKH